MYDLFLSRLAGVIGDRELDTLTPADIAMIWRATAEKRGVVTANRTKAVLSLVLNCGGLWDMMTIANPSAGMRGKKETGRQDILIDDELYAAVYTVANQPLRNAMDLADLCDNALWTSCACSAPTSCVATSSSARRRRAHSLRYTRC
ncbi:hypothetical protein [Burkholderia cenocepacia]|uniref:hypothetical protein n=1 Tax=Burkholderia cenocepacia TaxID=95486 RepID=UPI002010E23A|nr:hypothetical protein [Burkholderia cenocepacia]